MIEAPDTASGNGELGFQFGQLRVLVAAFEGASGGAQVSQYFALGHLAARHRHTLGSGQYAAGLRRLDAAAGIGVGNDLAVEFDGRCQIAVAGRTGADPELTLNRLRHEQAAIGEPLRAVAAGRSGGSAGSSRLLAVLAVIFIAVGKYSICKKHQHCRNHKTGHKTGDRPRFYRPQNRGLVFLF